MGLKNKNSIFDLVAGNSPVENMDSQIGPISQLPTAIASQVHIDSLQIVPTPPSNSPFQDLNGQQGPQFQLPTDAASQVHIDSLQVVPGGTQNSPYQDLDGVPDPNFNTLNGVSDSPFQGQTGDHMVDLLTQAVTSTNTSQVYNPAPNTSQYQDLNGLQGPNFDNGPSSTLQQDSLLNTYNYQYGNSPEIAGPVPGGDSNSTYQDLDGNPGPDFHGIVPTLHEDSLTQQYSYQHGDSAETTGPANLDLDGNQGPNFDNGPSSTLQQDSLLNIYNYQYGNPLIGAVSNESAGPSTLDLDGNPGPSFNSGISSTLKVDLLANIYQSGINPGASYGAGQPGGIWPAVNPSPLASTPFADLDGIMPSQYLNNMPN